MRETARKHHHRRRIENIGRQEDTQEVKLEGSLVRLDDKSVLQGSVGLDVR